MSDLYTALGKTLAVEIEPKTSKETKKRTKNLKNRKTDGALNFFP